MKVLYVPEWKESGNEASWAFSLDCDPIDLPDGVTVLSSFVGSSYGADLSQYRQNIALALDEGRGGLVGGVDGVAAEFVGDVILIENDYLDEFSVRIAPSELLRLLNWRIQIMESDGFRNPDALFGSIAIEYEAISRIDS